ncbi:MAG: S8/S53 family peptidase [Acidobacteria bacterium]|nr:S8/S53 family peptidase [Acidobacteriota bacterium]
MPKSQDRVVLEGSARGVLSGGQDVGIANLDQQIEVTVHLRRGAAKFPSAEQAGALPISRRSYLSREEFARAYGANPQDVEKLRVFAREYGLRVTKEDRAARLVKLAGPVRAFNEAFGVTLRQYRHPSGMYRCRTGTLSLPRDLAGVVEAVTGLDNRPQTKPHFRLRKPAPRQTASSYSPVQVAQAYNFPLNVDGSGQWIAIIELGGGYKAADLDSFFRGLGLKTPQVIAVSVDGGSNSPTGDPSGADGEVELDIEIAGSIAPGASIGVYFAPNTDQGFIDAVSAAVHDAKLKPAIISISWGGPESSWTAQARNALNAACQDAALMGVTVLAASGDEGATDGTNTPTVDFPAASPYVIGCGGTKLTLSGTSIASEQAWNELSANEGATGGGVSELFALPDYQQTANVPSAPNGFRGRGVPDVAADADPQSGYSVVVDGQSSVIGGTSAVAPLWAGLLARINQALGKNVGYVNVLLYSPGVESTFHDITSGTNGDYSAGPGWDACTGLGSPDGVALLSALKSG